MSFPFANRLSAHVQLLKNLIRNPKFWIIVCIDILLVALAHYLAYAMRFELEIPDGYQRQLTMLLPLLLLIKISCFYFFGLYRGMWRYTGLHDVVNILNAALCSSFLLIMILLFGNRFIGFSRSVFILDCLFTFCFVILHRVVIRYVYQKYSPSHWLVIPQAVREKKRLLLLGAGDAAEKVIRELENNRNLPYRAVGLLDDDPRKHGFKLHGVPVIGSTIDVAEHARRTQAHELLIAAVTADKTKMRRLVALCQQTQLPYKTLPSMGELIHGKVSITASRDISYKDLLGRDEVHLEQERIGAYLTSKTILITGAGGSIGSELCRQTFRFCPGLILLLDSSEENLYKVQMELRHEYENVKTVAILGKVQDTLLLSKILNQHRPSVIFHTAAYKHVPLVERNPWQAVDNNIIATRLLMEAAILYQVERFVLVSTDKAVRPTNVMGASKRVTELLMSAYSRHHWDGSLCPVWQTAGLDEQVAKVSVTHATRFMGVRFGNVLGSSGSVIPLFKRQIEKGGPVTVTHPEVTRYFMSAEEAAQLILQSGSMGEGGEIFILKMGEPVKIVDMARELIKLTGHEPDKEIDIRFIGLRAGEKLYEELITLGEGIVATDHEKIMVLRGEHKLGCIILNEHLEMLSEQAKNFDRNGLKKTLRRIVPEYKPDFTV